MLSAAFYIIIMFAIYGLLQKCLIDWPLVRRIRRSKNAKDAIACRQKLRFRRRLFLVLYVLIVFVLPQIGISMEAIEETGVVDPRFFLWVLVLPMILWGYLISDKNLDRLMGNISTSDKTSFLSDNADYVLYLRGFESDDYSSESKQLKKSRKRDSRFSEYYFTRVLQTKETVCAVGMTKEIEAPIGAQRIYLDDETWQGDVLDLMRAAKEIYILVNDRPSCIWEIDQSLSMLDKTIFLVDEREKYDKVHQLGYEHGIEFPPIPHSTESLSNDFVAIRFKDGKVNCRSYDKSLKGYADMLGIPVPRIRKPGIGCGFACAFVVVFVIYILGSQSLEAELPKMLGSVPRPCDREYGVLVANVLDNVAIPTPENCIEVVRDSERFAELEKANEGKIIGLRRFDYTGNSELEFGGLQLNGAMNVGISARVHVKRVWYPFSFESQMEEERRSNEPGKIISSQKEENYQVGETVYDKYEINTSVIYVSDVSDKSFSYSFLEVEKFVKGAQVTTIYTLTTGRFILINGKILTLMANDYYLDRDEAIRHVEEQGKRLERWGEAIEVSNTGVVD